MSENDPMDLITARLEAAERVCLMFGWSGADNSDRGKALNELWVEWIGLFQAMGGSLEPRHHPELSDARIRELAARRDATVARTVARMLLRLGLLEEPVDA